MPRPLQNPTPIIPLPFHSPPSYPSCTLVPLPPPSIPVRLVSSERVQQGVAALLAHRPLLSRLEQQYGVPPHVLVAVWGIESR